MHLSTSQNQNIKNNFQNKNLEFFKIALLFIVGIVVIFAIPNKIFPFQLTKITLISLSTLIFFLIWLICGIKNKDLSLSNNPIIYSLLFILVANFISSLFTGGSRIVSVVGNNIEQSTVLFMLIMFSFLVFFIEFLKSERYIRLVFLGVWISYFASIIFLFLRSFFDLPVYFWGNIQNQIPTPIGMWSDFGLFMIFVSVGSLVSLYSESFSENRFVRILLHFTLFTSSILLFAINSSASFILFIISAFYLIYYIYYLYKNTNTLSKFSHSKIFLFLKTPALYTILLLVLLVSTPLITNKISNFLGVNHAEIRPSFSLTYDIAKSVSSESLAVGIGPNQFTYAWWFLKPQEINNTPFWNSTFSTGFSHITTTIIETGLLGVLTWLALFLVFILYFLSIYKTILRKNKDTRFLFFSTSLLFFLGYIMIFIYTPSVPILFILFVLLAVYIRLLQIHSSRVGMSKINIFGNKRGYVTKIIIFILVCIMSYVTYFSINIYFSSVMYKKYVEDFNLTNDIDEFKDRLVRLSKYRGNDLYYRIIAQMESKQIQDVLSNPPKTENAEFITDIQDRLSRAVDYSHKSIKYNQSNYLNWIALGGVYESVVSFGIDNATDKAMDAYIQAQKLNPTNPSIDLAIARLYFIDGQIEAARDVAVGAIRKKQDFVDAYYLLSQIDISQNNIDSAIGTIDGVFKLDNQNIYPYVRLASMLYNSNNLEDSIRVLQKALSFDPENPDARYLLSILYYSKGDTMQAVDVIEDLINDFPDNKDFATLLNSFKR